MKTIRRILTLGLLGVLTALPSFAASAKSQTYTVVGFCDRTTPSADLVSQAAKAVGVKMVGMTQVQDAENADHTVEILFKRGGGFEVYVDALPLEKKRLKLETKQALYDTFREQPERQRDAADGGNERR